jgi:hypothetical protein
MGPRAATTCWPWTWTLRPVPWLQGTAMVPCGLAWEDGSDVVASPRQILRRQLGRLAERGWSANAGTELEFMVFRETYESAWHKAYRDLEPATSTTSITPCLAPRGSSRSSVASATPWRARGWPSRTPRASATTASTRSTFTTRTRCAPPTTTRSTRTPPRRGWRSATWRSSTSARAARATSPSRWPTATGATRLPPTRGCSSRSWPASSPACAT